MYTTKKETLSFRADAFSTDFKRELSYDVLGRDLLNCAENHASKRGFGFHDLYKANHSWVLSRLTIEMKQLPPIYSAYHIDTWIESIYRMFTNRNFCVRADDGSIYGYARSVWAMIDNTTRQPLDLNGFYGDKFQPFLAPEIECAMEGHSRLRPLVDVEPSVCIEAKYSDLDCNGHFNSIKYISHILDLFSREYHEAHHIRRAEIAYVAEAYYGDRLSFFAQEQEPLRFHVEIRKHFERDGKGETIARALIVFE